MKKIILLGGALLYVGLTMAQTEPVTPPKSPPAKTVTQPELPIKTEITIAASPVAATELIEKNIDRRLMYFNRYKKTDDMESLAKLVSDENKDFYINFIKYVKESPVFSLKRDTSTKIVKTPTGDYVLSVIMTLEGVDNKVSMTFFEEKSETGTKWLIIDSNLHIQSAGAKLGNTLASSTITRPIPKKIPTRTTNSTTSTDVGTSIKTTPVVSNPAPETAKNAAETSPAPAPAQETISPKGVSNMTIIIIALGIIVGIGVGVFGFIKWKHKHTILAAAVTATTAIVSATPLAPPPPTINNTPEATPALPLVPAVDSNVIVSTVEEIALGSEVSSTNNSQEIAPILYDELIVPVPASPENAASIMPVIEPIEPESPAATEIFSETIPTSGEEPPIATQETISEKPMMEESLTNEAPQFQAKEPVADIFSQTEVVAQKPQETQSLDQAMNNSPLFTEKTEPPVEDNQAAHALFDSIFAPAEAPKPETGGLFTDILKSGS